MDPFSALLIAVLVAGYWTRNVVQDFTWKARGEDPPSFRREQERIARREARRPITDKRAARAFWANAWADAWESAGEKRERIHNQRLERRRSQWAEEDLADAEDEAYERNRRVLDPEVVAPRTETNEPKQVEPNSAPTGRCDMCPREVPTDQLATRKVGHDLKFLCPNCTAAIDANPIPLDSRSEPERTGPKDWQPSCWRCGAQPAAVGAKGFPLCREHSAFDGQPAAWPDPEPEPVNKPEADGPDATVIQFPKSNTTDQEHPMSINGETTNLTAALAYTSGMAASAREGMTSAETSIANLTAGGVSGPTIAELSAAMEALSSVAAHFDAAHAALVRHIQVQEAYAANQDAGNKQFVTAD